MWIHANSLESTHCNWIFCRAWFINVAHVWWFVIKLQSNLGNPCAVPTRHQVNVWLLCNCFSRRCSFFFFSPRTATSCSLSPVVSKASVEVVTRLSSLRFAFDWAKRGNAMATSSWWIKAVIGKRKTPWLHSLTRTRAARTDTHAPIRAHTHLIKREHKPEDNLLLARSSPCSAPLLHEPALGFHQGSQTWTSPLPRRSSIICRNQCRAEPLRTHYVLINPLITLKKKARFDCGETVCMWVRGRFLNVYVKLLVGVWVSGQ